MENTIKTTTHPLILVAAGAVTIAALAAAAHFTGLLPGKSETPAQLASAPAVVAPAAAPTPAPVAAPVAKPETTLTVPAGSTVTIAPEGSKQASATRQRASEPARKPRQTETVRQSDDGYRRVSNSDAGVDVIAAPRSYPAQNAPAAPAACRDCGTVDSVREVSTKGEGSGLGAIGGAVLGGVLGNQVGNGKGRDAATVVGAIGGAVAGHHIEKNVRSEKQYQVSVRFDDGTFRTYTLTNTQWRAGDRVRLSNGGLAAL